MTVKQPIKQVVRERFQDVRLTPEQLGALRRSAGISQRQAARRPPRIVAIAAVILVSIAVGWLGGTVFDARQTDRLLNDIATEVIANHLKLKPLDVRGSDLANVLAYFDRLDFQPLGSSRIAAGPGDSLEGGRYCSVQGIAAAQLRVSHGDGALSTWYVASLPPEQMVRIPDPTRGDPPAEVLLKGVRVSLWQEHGLLYVEARPAASTMTR
jgi:anti-sigma factor RsiW